MITRIMDNCIVRFQKEYKFLHYTTGKLSILIKPLSATDKRQLGWKQVRLQSEKYRIDI